LDIGVLGYIGIVQHKEHSPEVVTLTRGTPCIYIYIYTHHKSIIGNGVIALIILNLGTGWK